MAHLALACSPKLGSIILRQGNETPAPSFLEHVQGMETARDTWLKVRNEERLKRASRARNWTIGTIQTL